MLISLHGYNLDWRCACYSRDRFKSSHNSGKLMAELSMEPDESADNTDLKLPAPKV